jgi:hypothetical protein
MDPTKSQAEFYFDLQFQLIANDPLDTTSRKSLAKDLSVLTDRFLHEGLSFLTKTLPKLGKALDHGLANLRFKLPREFKSSHVNRSIPAFLQAYFNLIFSEDGSLRPEAPPAAVRHLRQVLFFAYKLELPYEPSVERSVLERFKETDEQLGFVDFEASNDVLSLASRITGETFRDFDPWGITPRHGPGAVATGERLDDKWTFARLYNKIHQCYPYYRYYTCGWGRELADRRDWYFSLERLESGVAKVVLVPKDSRGPRLISAEPLEYQFIQQGLGRSLARHLEAVNPLTRFRINFTSQEVNRSLALASSTSQVHTTMDLKDASDRVSLELVRRVFKDSPDLLRCLEATRTEATLLPNGEVVKLQKFAPMGSALCFPVEAYIFWVLLVASAVLEERLPLKLAARSVYVYGDDIIIPTTWLDRSIRVLESVGLLVNRDKTCSAGPFRESCGMDAFKGVPVTPIRLRHQYSDRRQDGSVLASYCSIASQLESSGYKEAANLIWTRLERTYGKIPYGTSTAGYPCRVVSDPVVAEMRNLKTHKVRWNRRFHRREFFVPSVLPVRRGSKLSGWPRLLRGLVQPAFGDPSEVVVPRSTLIKRGWRVVG